MYVPPAHELLVSWQIPVFPGGAHVVGEESALGQHWLDASPGQYPETQAPPTHELLVLWQTPVFPGGLQAIGDGADVLASGQRLIELSPGQ